MQPEKAQLRVASGDPRWGRGSFPPTKLVDKSCT